ncbi:hypothetical protein LZ31DRAFT_556404 [Colletotrichum somersetense]|nr:hypothetical protein LZ31DRAFT_556404 [Colletotrichum somersetense]
MNWAAQLALLPQSWPHADISPHLATLTIGLLLTGQVNPSALLFHAATMRTSDSK